MEHRFEIVTFDCYGTLIDWERGIGAAFVEAARRAGIETTERAVVAAHEAVEPEIQRGPYRPYREVLRLAAQAMAERLGWRLSARDATCLADSLPSWRPFEDTNRALRRLRNAGCRLGILSNVDDDLLRGTLKHLDVDFDPLITAERVRSYKPAPAHFLEARARIGKASWLHAARSHFHDITPCAELGIPAAWVNRSAAAPSSAAEALFEVDSLDALADRLLTPETPIPKGP